MNVLGNPHLQRVFIFYPPVWSANSIQIFNIIPHRLLHFRFLLPRGNFFPREDWTRPTANWSRNIKKYSYKSQVSEFSIFAFLETIKLYSLCICKTQLFTNVNSARAQLTQVASKLNWTQLNWTEIYTYIYHLVRRRGRGWGCTIPYKLFLFRVSGWGGELFWPLCLFCISTYFFSTSSFCK